MLETLYHHRPFKFKIAILTTATAVAVIAVMSACFLILELKSYRNDVENERLQLLDIVSDNIAAAVVFDDDRVIDETLQVFDMLPELNSAVLYSLDGNIRALHMADPNMPVEVEPRLLGESSSRRVSFHSGILTVQVPVYKDADLLGSLQINTTLQKLHDKIEIYLWIALVVTVIAILLAAVLGRLFGSFLSRPIEDLALAMTKAKDESDYQQPVANGSMDELGNLSRRFDELMKEIHSRDLRLEKRAKELVIEKENAEAASKTKSEFLANMSHELRTPMNGVMGLAELLTKTELNEHQKMYAETIFKSGTALTTILNDILDFSKIEAGKLELDPIPFSLAEAFEDVVTLLSTAALEKELNLSLNLDPNLPPLVEGDSGRFRQILTNLIGNAVKFTPKGHVHVNVCSVNVGKNVSLHISIEDTGIGISPDKIDLIFSKFTQAEGTTTREYGGTGLGLAITRNLVEAMGGIISVESIIGCGSIFRLELMMPIARKEIVDCSTRSSFVHVPKQIEGQSEARILVAEDNAVNRLVIEAFLNGSKYSVTFTENGRECYDAFLSETFDLVLMDISMPIMDGLEATKAIRAHEEYAERNRVPIIALTAHAMTGDKKRFIDAGLDDHLPKPVKQNDLEEMLKRWLRSEAETPMRQTGSS